MTSAVKGNRGDGPSYSQESEAHIDDTSGDKTAQAPKR